MRDIEVRKVLLSTHLKGFLEDPNSRIVEELPVLYGKSIADIAIFNCTLHTYEIKTNLDTLLRLPKQIEDYAKVFDHISVVSGSRYISKIDNLVPTFVGLYGIFGQNIIEIRKPQQNTNTDCFSRAQLLGKRDLFDLLLSINTESEISASRIKKMRLWELWELASSTITDSDLVSFISKLYKNKFDNHKIRASLVK